MKISIVGTGKMGSEIAKLASSMGVVVSSTFDVNDKITPEATKGSDVFIDFTSKDAFIENLPLLLACNKPIVVGTTGWYDKLAEVQSLVKKSNGTLMYASNFSLGVQLFVRMVKEAAKLIAPFDNFDIALTETHHTAKLDYPSGTALQTANQILGAMSRKKQVVSQLEQDQAFSKENLLISSLRLGTVFGVHHVHIDSLSDEILISHQAKNRSAFAEGAIIAAKWVANKKGFFSIDNFIDDRLANAENK